MQLIPLKRLFSLLNAIYLSGLLKFPTAPNKSPAFSRAIQIVVSKLPLRNRQTPQPLLVLQIVMGISSSQICAKWPQPNEFPPRNPTCAHSLHSVLPSPRKSVPTHPLKHAYPRKLLHGSALCDHTWPLDFFSYARKIQLSH